jgi:hypothetical protein
MNAIIPVAVAPNFHLDSPADRLLVVDGSGWRALTDAEHAAHLALQATPIEPNSRVLLFTIPARLRTACWAVLEQKEGDTGFDGVAAEIGKFLRFKQLPPPERALFELVLHGPAGKTEPGDLWAIVNLGDDPVLIGLPELRVRLGTAEGCRLPEGLQVTVVPPDGETPHLLLVMRAGLASK